MGVSDEALELAQRELEKQLAEGVKGDYAVGFMDGFIKALLLLED